MREIKFRAWDRNEKVMIYNVEQTYDYDCRGKGGCNECCFGEVLEDLKYYVMQYTGVKDKDGKEIYAGDIVRLCLSHFSSLWTENGEKPPLDDVRLCSVEVEELTTYLVETNNNSVFSLGDVVSRVLRYEASVEVLGNCFENPELLEIETA